MRVSQPVVIGENRRRVFSRIHGFFAAWARRIPVTDRLDGYERVAKAYEHWADHAATPQAAAYWANHARAIREMIAELYWRRMPVKRND